MDKKKLFKNFEENWGRFLSPFEIEDINKWIDEEGFSVEVVNEALRETVSYNVRNLHYLNRVLSKWKNENVKSLEAVRYTREQWALKKSKQGYQNQVTSQPSGRKTNVPSWVDEPYKTEATPEELEQLEELKNRMLGNQKTDD